MRVNASVSPGNKSPPAPVIYCRSPEARPTKEAIEKRMPPCKTRLKAQKTLCTGTTAFYFEKPKDFEFAAGQFVNFTLLSPGGTDLEGNTRSLSIASAPHEQSLMVAMRLRPTAFKRSLNSLPPGAELLLQGPYGSLTLSREGTRPVVFLAGMEDGLFPHQRSVADLAGLEEERRLAYVGMTRAMRQLYITYAEQRRLYGVDTYGQPSRFISELPAELVEEIRPRLQVSRPVFVKRSATLEESPAPNMRMGSRVRHSKFGDGVVLNFEGNGPHARIQVNFERQGTKWLMLSYANLVRVE